MSLGQKEEPKGERFIELVNEVPDLKDLGKLPLCLVVAVKRDVNAFAPPQSVLRGASQRIENVECSLGIARQHVLLGDHDVEKVSIHNVSSVLGVPPQR
jgi:hypothetical protein